MVVIGLYIRLGISETPVFAKLVEADRLAKIPTIEVIKRQPKAITLTALARSVEQGPAYIYFSFIFVYANMVLHVSRELILGALLLASCVDFVLIPLTGHLSDRFGRNRGGATRSLVEPVLVCCRPRRYEPSGQPCLREAGLELCP
jgi:hypothetical protein